MCINRNRLTTVVTPQYFSWHQSAKLLGGEKLRLRTSVIYVWYPPPPKKKKNIFFYIILLLVYNSTSVTLQMATNLAGHHVHLLVTSIFARHWNCKFTESGMVALQAGYTGGLCTACITKLPQLTRSQLPHLFVRKSKTFPLLNLVWLPQSDK